MSETGHRSLLEIIESLPAHPTTGQILGALVRAERAGYERGLRTTACGAAGVGAATEWSEEFEPDHADGTPA